ncbi:MAG TPA: hypothetical protein VEA69_18055 [Tepidisphaeraceae bacterium]|nr:hypothetical protein [Tepidisphaeraceae bacterium]
MSEPAPSKAAAASPAQGSSGYEVARARGQCVVCSVQIEPGQPLMAALRETQIGFERLDVCVSDWPNFDKADLVGFWRTVMPRHEQKKKLFVDDQVLCDLFERLSEATEPAKLNFRFVLGLILMRKRLIVYEASRQEDGAEIWAVRFRGKDARLDLLNPKLNDSQIAEVGAQLGEILNEEL